MTQKQPLVVGNWKNGLGVAESVRLAQLLVHELAGTTHAEVVVAPSFLALLSVVEVLRDTRIGVAAQNIGTDEICTGEIRAEQVVPLGVTYVMVGHSERRIQWAESDDDIAAKVVEAIRAELIPIVCVGETRAERQAHRTTAVLRRQITKSIATLKSNSPMVIAYEPVWAIGAKRPAAPKIIREAHDAIRNIFGRSARIIYGGAVDAQSVSTLAVEPFIDGLLVGRAGLDAAQFHAIIQAYESLS